MTSSHYVPKYAQSKFFPVVSLFVEEEDVQAIEMLDILSPQVQALIKGVSDWIPYTCLDRDPLPNISRRMYGTTTLYWVIAMYNGIIHPLEIQAGQLLKIPSLNAISSRMKKATNPSRLGEVITI